MLQHKIQRLLDEAVESGSEEALQVAVYQHGELVVDAWAAPEGVSIDGDSLFPFFSTGKGIASTAIHRLVEQSILGYDIPIAQYWPEFAAAGKQHITLRHALTHTAGLPNMPGNCSREQILDYDFMCNYLAEATPLHAPGEQPWYHAITFAWLIGETARRADGRDIAQIIREETCDSLAIKDIYFGVPDSELARCLPAQKALGDEGKSPEQDPKEPSAVPPCVIPLEDWINHPLVRKACIPASNGFGSARAVARHYAALIGQGIDGVRLLQEDTIERATRPNLPGNDLKPEKWRGLGYLLDGPDTTPGLRFGHGGYGGSKGLADKQKGLAIAINKNRMGGPLTERILDTVFGQTESTAR